MQRLKVKEFMVPLDEYATIDEDSFLVDAVMSLKNAQENFDKKSYRHRAILVFDKNKEVVGKLSQLDVMRSLEPKYHNLGNFERISLSGLSTQFINSIMDDHSLWQENIEMMSNRVRNVKVKDVMYTPIEGEKIDLEASMSEALHAIIIGRHQSLLITKESHIVGVLRLTDVFTLVSEKILEPKK